MRIELPHVAMLYLAAVATAIAIQLSLGADAWVLLVMTALSGLGLVPLQARRFGASDAIFLGIILYSATLGLILKSALFQPVESNLVVPYESSAYLLVGTASAFFGYLASKTFKAKPLPQQAWQARLFRRPVATVLAVPVFVVGVATQFTHAAVRGGVDPGRGVEEAGIGAFGTFYFLVVLGVALQGSRALSEGTRRDRAILTLMIVTVITMSIIGNIKKPIGDVILLLGLMAFAYRVRVPLSALFGFIILLLFVTYVAGPAIHITRSEVFGLGSLERLSLAWRVLIDNNFDVVELNALAGRIAQGFTRTYSGSYFYPSTANLERFALIQPIDQVVRAYPLVGLLSGRLYNDIAQILLPSALVQKSVFASADYIGWHFGFVQSGNMARPVVGMVASCFAQLGFAGVAVIPGILTCLSFSLLNRFTGPLRCDAFTAFVITMCSLLPEKEIAPYVGYFLRDFAIMLVVTRGLLWLAERQSRSQVPGGGPRNVQV